MRRNFNLWHGFAASIVIHLCLVLPFVVQLPQEKKAHTLKIELLGRVSDRQFEQTQAMQPSQPAAAPPPEEHKDLPKPEERKIIKETPGHPIRKKPSPQPTHEAVFSTPSPPVQETVAAQSAPQTHLQQVIRHVDADEDAFKGYLIGLKRKLQNNLIYPDSAKLSGLRGIAVVAFTVTETGEIEDGSLRIARSSGFPELDTDALATTRLSAPFERPSKEFNVVVAVAFYVNN